MVDDYQPHYVTTPAPAGSLNGDLIGKEVMDYRERWLEVEEIFHARRFVTIHTPRDILVFLPNEIVKYRNKQ